SSNSGLQACRRPAERILVDEAARFVNARQGEPLRQRQLRLLENKMIQITELHYRREPNYDHADVKARAQEILESRLESSDPSESDTAFLIVHTQHPIAYTQGHLPAQTAILATDQAPQVDS